MSQKKDKQTVLRRHKMKRWMVFVIMAAICIPAGFAAFYLKPDIDKDINAGEPATGKEIVTVRSVEPQTCGANISAFGEVVPQRQITVKSQVEGRVVFLSDRLETGNQIKKGELLVRVEQSAFQLQVAEAENRLAVARINLMKEEREAKDAQTNWKQSGLQGEPASPLVLRVPQLTAARSEVKAAQAALQYARTMLLHTEIRAPFDAVVVRRNVNQGQVLFAADEIATLFGTESVEISIHLDPGSWDLLPKNVRQAKVMVFDTGKPAGWQAAVVRKSYHLDGQSRLRTLILRVKHPMDLNPPLLPGTFVRAEITGRQVPHLLKIPQSALTKQGLVWFVDQADKLKKHHVDPLFYDNGFACIPVPTTTGKGPLRVAVFPNSSFVDGLAIQPLPQKEKSDVR